MELKDYLIEPRGCEFARSLILRREGLFLKRSMI